MNGGNTHVECCVRRHTGQATLLALRDTNRDRPARDRARPQRLPAPGLTRPFPWQEAGDLKTLASMQARPVTPHVAEKPLAPGRGGAEYGARVHGVEAYKHAARARAHLLQGGEGQRDLPPSPPALLAPPGPAQCLCDLTALDPQTAGDSRRGGATA